MKNNKALKWVNTAFLLAMLAVNALANLVPFGKGSTGEISELYPNLFTPAPVTFAIWGVIYFFMAVFIVYQWGPFDRTGASDKLVKRVGPWFALSCALNIGWIFAWHFDKIGLSVLLIFALLFSLIVLSYRTEAGREDAFDRRSVARGFDLYFGWNIAASIADVSVWLTKLDWNGFGLPETFWTIAVLLLGAVIGAMTVLIRRKWAAGLAVIWAYAGILIRHLTAGTNPGIVSIAIIGISLMLAAIFVSFLGAMQKNSKWVSLNPVNE